MSNDVSLRDVAEADLPTFFEHQLDPDAIRMADFPARTWEAFSAHWRRVLADKHNIVKTIQWNGMVVGNIGSWEQSGERLVGYWIGKEYWGKGIATRALSQLVHDVETRPLYAHVAKHNIASIRVLEKCGFTMEDKATGAPDPSNESGGEFVLVLA